MKRLSAAGLLALGIAHATYAQDWASTSPQANRATTQYVVQFSAPSAPTTLSWKPLASTGPGDPTFGPLLIASEPSDKSSFSRPYSAERLSLPNPDFSLATSSDASPASPSPYSYMGREYRMQLGVGIAFVRFRSSAFSASAVGVNTSFSYFLKDWLALDGSVTSAFAPAVYSDNVRYMGYAAGPRAVLSRGRWESWAHALIGGVHVSPQTALGGKNGFELQLGGGADYNLNPHFAIRIEADWLRTNLFSQSQNSGQGILGVVYNF